MNLNDRLSIIATGVLAVLFITCGLLNLLDLLVVRLVVFGLFLGIIVNIIVVKSKEEDEKNLPE
ncbi:MAG: hypothetical protein HKO92_04685 [Flavobacteriaceae bacterium]|nr:hypothetical protein [Bacteroidia bacterium]NNK82397.1 hypothetical protein [Flavobacteriaceae bacterium]